MDIKQLTYFVQVAKDGNFSVAAKKLYISQPALSKGIKNLEEELGVQLLNRSEKRTVLTGIGEEFFERAEKLIEQYRELLDAMQDEDVLKRGSVKVGLPPIISSSYFAPVIAEFRKLYKGVDVRVVEEGAKLVQEQVKSGNLDIGVVILPVSAEDFEITPVVQDRCVLAVNKNHELAQRDFVTIDDLRGYEMATLNEDFMLYYLLLDACRSAGFEPNIWVKSAQWDFIIELVVSNHNITVLPRPILERYRNENIRLIELRHTSSAWDIVIISKKGRYQSSAVRRFIDYVVKNISTTRDA